MFFGYTRYNTRYNTRCNTTIIVVFYWIHPVQNGYNELRNHMTSPNTESVKVKCIIAVLSVHVLIRIHLRTITLDF